jgi:MFS transporter, ACS family, glucarate transporter
MVKRTNKRYILILLLFFHTVNTYMDRIVISAASVDIKADLNITDQMMGLIFGIFALGYALFQIPSGWVADKYGPRKALTAVVSLWSTFTALSGLAWNAISMLFIRFLFGVGEAGAFPGATRAFYKWVPALERSLAQGFFHSGARVGAAFSLFLMPFLIDLIGWRMTFILNGLIGIIWALIWYFWFRDSPADHRGVNKTELEYIKKGLEEQDETHAAESDKIPLGQIITSRNMLLAMFQYIASNVTFFISFTWLLPYMTGQWGEVARYYAWVPLAVGTTAHWTAGWFGTYLYEKGKVVASRRAPAITGFAISVFGLFLTILVGGGSPLAYVLCFSVAVFGVEMTISPSWSFCMDIGGAKSGAVSGAMNMLGNLGSAFSAIIFPVFVASVTLPYFAETTGTANSFFVFAATLNSLAIVAWMFMNPKRVFKPMSKKKIRQRLIIFLVISMVLVGGLLIYNLL